MSNATWATLPDEIKERMLYEQVNQGNKKDETVFINCIAAERKDGGFDWSFTENGWHFWGGIILWSMFERFFKKYPKLNA